MKSISVLVSPRSHGDTSSCLLDLNREESKRIKGHTVTNASAVKQAASYYSMMCGSVKLLQSYFQFQKVNNFTKSRLLKQNLNKEPRFPLRPLLTRHIKASALCRINSVDQMCGLHKKVADLRHDQTCVDGCFKTGTFTNQNKCQLSAASICVKSGFL